MAHIYFIDHFYGHFIFICFYELQTLLTWHTRTYCTRTSYAGIPYRWKPSWNSYCGIPVRRRKNMINERCQNAICLPFSAYLYTLFCTCEHEVLQYSWLSFSPLLCNHFHFCCLAIFVYNAPIIHYYMPVAQWFVLSHSFSFFLSTTVSVFLQSAASLLFRISICLHAWVADLARFIRTATWALIHCTLYIARATATTSFSFEIACITVYLSMLDIDEQTLTAQRTRRPLVVLLFRSILEWFSRTGSESLLHLVPQPQVEFGMNSVSSNSTHPYCYYW